MTLAQMIAAAQEELRTAITARSAAQDALMALRSDPNLTEDAVAERTRARDEADNTVTTRQARLDALVAEQVREDEVAELSQRVTPAADRPVGGARVTSEPEVYRKGGDTSYFRDLYRASQFGDRTSVERLARNDKQVRALTTVDGAGGDFVPPTWMVSQFVNLARAGRVVADQISQQPLPGGTDTISLPRLATGTAVAEQSTQNSAVQNTDATTSSVSAAVTTIAGQQVVSQQLLDQSPVNMDDILLADLAADYAIKLDTFVISNNATNKVGLLSVSGLNAVAYTDASPTPGELYAKVADAIQQIHTGRFMPADKIFMHPRRWAWFLSALDTAGRPLVTPDAMNSIAQASGVNSQGRVGVLQGLDVFVDPNIPVNLGAGTNEDRIIILRSSDVVLYEGTPRAETFRETYAQNLSVMLRFYNYAAVHASRLPKSISVIAGTGLVTPVFGV
ncbi:phage major capsid protein [Micromonospora zamorensis]|uniref:phage major capsid protein n=1 Tax=Micromonospora zamorensis TaxID=709883 RepID=UPI0036AA8AE9